MNQEQASSICKYAVKECLQSARYASAAYREPEQIENFANTGYEKADYDKPDFETFKDIYVKAYAKAQELLIQKPPAFSITTSANPSQLSQTMLWEEKIHEGEEASNASYAIIAERVEAAVGIAQESEVPS